MHVELIVPGLLDAPPALRLPALELLLARGRATPVDPEGVQSWLGDAFGVRPLPAGALTAGAPGFWLRADPVHLSVMGDRLVLVPVAGLTRAEAEALTGTLNRHFAGTHEFRCDHPDRWVMRTAPAAFEAPPTADIAGRDVDPHLPGGHWPALLNEIQMALHEHPMTGQREHPVNSVWLWGAGTLPASVTSPWRSVTADDPVALGLARIAGVRHQTLPRDAGAWLAEMRGDGRHLVMLEVAHASLESDWCAPLLVALKRGRAGLLTLRAPQAGFAVEIARGDLRRFWRRARAVGSHATR